MSYRNWIRSGVTRENLVEHGFAYTGNVSGNVLDER